MSEIRDGYIIDCVSGQELKATPEEVQAVQPFAMKLMADYDYPKSHIQTRPQWHVKVRPSDVKKEYPVDIAVYIFLLLFIQKPLQHFSGFYGVYIP